MCEALQLRIFKIQNARSVRIELMGNRPELFPKPRTIKKIPFVFKPGIEEQVRILGQPQVL